MKKECLFGYKGAIRVYSLKLFLKASLYPIIITSIIVYLYDIEDNSGLLEQLEKLSNLIITIFPSLLAFLISGYALIVGFSSSDFIDYITLHANGKESIYQKLNVVFLFCIFSCFATLLFGFIVQTVMSLNIACRYAEEINICVLVFMIYQILFGIFTIKDVSINIFNFGQLRHHKSLNNKKK